LERSVSFCQIFADFLLIFGDVADFESFSHCFLGDFWLCQLLVHLN